MIQDLRLSLSAVLEEPKLDVNPMKTKSLCFE